MRFYFAVGIALAISLLAIGVPGHVSAVSKDPASPILDGSGIGGCSNLYISCSATLTTTHSNDVVIAYVAEALQAQLGAVCVFSISDTAGLSWAPRSGVVFQRSGRDQLQEWWARSPNMLSSDTVTESILGCGPNYNGVQVFGISGANFNDPFDPNLTLPGTGNGDPTAPTVSAKISATNPNDIVFAGVDQDNGAFPTAQTGFTMITSIGGFGSEYEIAAGTLTDSTVSFSFASPSYWEVIADAVQPTGTAPPPTSASSLSASVSVAPLYFPGETAIIYIRTELNGQPSTVSTLNLSLVLPNGSNASLKAVQITTGLERATYSIPSTGAIGSYGVWVTAHKEGVGDASALTTFEVKPTWLQAHGQVILGATGVIGAVGVVSALFAWKQGALLKRRDESPFT